MTTRIPARPTPSKMTRTVLELTLDHAYQRPVTDPVTGIPYQERVPPLWRLEVKHQLAAADGAHAGWTTTDTWDDLVPAEKQALRGVLKSIIARNAADIAVTEASN